MDTGFRRCFRSIRDETPAKAGVHGLLIVTLFAGLLMLALPLATGAARADEATVRISTLKFGTVTWALETMVANGFDREAGFRAELQGLASTQATKVALQAGDTDVIAADWIWVSRQRAAGENLTFLPFSTAVGALVVPAESPIQAITDLPGRRIGIAGGPLDKSWVLLRAVAERAHGLDLEDSVDAVYGAPPLLNELLQDGRIDAVLTYWHYAARLEAKGYRPVMPVRDLMRALDVSAPLPVIGFVFHQTWAEAHPAAAAGFADALNRALDLLKRDDAAWQWLKPRLRAADAATADLLRDGFRRGIPDGNRQRWPDDAARLFAVLSEHGGPRLVGPAPTLQPGTFWAPGN